jgi:cullin 3
VDSKDSFSFNSEFSSALQKIKISTISSKVESNEERKETNDRIEEERKHQTEVGFIHDTNPGTISFTMVSQACIVRVMKDRKRMAHGDLINEVTRQLAVRFHPNPLDIKKRIEGLIEVCSLGSSVCRNV